MQFYEWHDTDVMFKLMKAHGLNFDNKKEIRKTIGWIMAHCQRQFPNDRASAIAQASFLIGIVNWHSDKRPYYNVYPKIAEAVIKTPLDIQLGQVNYPTSSGSLLVRMRKGYPLNGYIQTVFISPLSFRENEIVISVQAKTTYNDDSAHFTVSANMTDTAESVLTTSIIKTANAREDHPLQKSMAEDCMRLALGTALLDQTPELFVPDVLNCDKEKINNTDDTALLERLHSKAIKRGKHGWIVGECTEPAPGREVAPHYRKPHFSIRWTGHGRTIPKLCAIKGSVVHREKMTEVPTGYLDEEKGV